MGNELWRGGGGRGGQRPGGQRREAVWGRGRVMVLTGRAVRPRKTTTGERVQLTSLSVGLHPDRKALIPLEAKQKPGNVAEEMQ